MISLATLFYHPVDIPFAALLWPLVPLCLLVALVYKTVRVEDIRKLPHAVIALVGYMVGGLVALGVALWLIHTYWPA